MILCICKENLHKIKGTFNMPMLSVAINLYGPPKSLDELGGLLLY